MSNSRNNEGKSKPGRLPSPTNRGSVVRSMLSNAAGDLELGRNTEAFMLPLDHLVPNPKQARQTYDNAKEQELTESIAAQGILQPLLVRKLGPSRYEIVAGERRYRAAIRLKILHVPVVVKDFDDDQARVAGLIENLQRSDLPPLDEARYFQYLMDEFNVSQGQIADFIHRSRSYVGQRLALLQQSQVEIAPLTDSAENHNLLKNSKLREKSQSAKPVTQAALQKPLVRFHTFLDTTIADLDQIDDKPRQYLAEQVKELRLKLDDLEKQLKKK